MSVTVSVVVTSYNRPRMLDACLRSVAAARPDEIYVADDGSNFNVAVVAGRALYPRVKYGIEANPPFDVETRMKVPRQGELINRTFALTSGDIQLLICDDDLMAEGWLDTLRAHWAIRPKAQIVRGKWLLFQDGDTPTLADPPSPMCQARKMTAGNFAWSADLTRSGLARWPETQLNCLDDGFLRSLQKAKVDVFRVQEVGFAGWRREHALANGNFSNGKDHLPAFRALLEAGYLEAVQ